MGGALPPTMLGPRAWDSSNTGTLEGQSSHLYGAPGLPHFCFDVGVGKTSMEISPAWLRPWTRLLQGLGMGVQAIGAIGRRQESSPQPGAVKF